MGQASGNGTKRNCLGARRCFRNWGQTGRAIKLATTAVLDPERILNEQYSESAQCRPGRPIGQSTLQRDQMILRYGLIRSRSIAMLIIATHC